MPVEMKTFHNEGLGLKWAEESLQALQMIYYMASSQPKDCLLTMHTWYYQYNCNFFLIPFAIGIK